MHRLRRVHKCLPCQVQILHKRSGSEQRRQHPKNSRLFSTQLKFRCAVPFEMYVSNARILMSLTKKVSDSDSQLVIKGIYQIFTKIELQRVYLCNNNGFNIRVDEVF